MGKVEKELLKTYYHARQAAVNQHGLSPPYREDELLYGIQNDLVDVNDEKVYRHSAKLLWKYPELVDKLNLNKLKNKDIIQMIQRQPHLIDHEFFKKRAKLLNGIGVAFILSVQDKLINKFNISDFGAKEIIYLLRFKPHLWEYFKNKFNIFDADNMGELLYNKPELIDVYNWDFSKWDDMMFAEFFHLHPQYKTHKKLKKYWREYSRKYNLDNKDQFI